jgi:hypothetical protein
VKSAARSALTRTSVVLTVALVVAGSSGYLIASLASASASQSFTQPTSSPFTVPVVQSGAQAGTPLPFPVAGTGYLTNQNVFIEICDGLPSSNPAWDPTADCDLVTSPAASTAQTTAGNVSWPATLPSNSIGDFRGQSPQQIFNCVAQQDVPSGTPQNSDGSYNLDGVNGGNTQNGEPIAQGVESWLNCQVRMSSNNSSSTTDQVFITTTIPNTPTATAQVTLGVSPQSPQSAGTSVTLSATVTGSGPPPTGTVTFADAGAPITGCSPVTLTLPTTSCTWTPTVTGTHQLTAIYNAASPYATVTSTALSYLVNPAVGPTATVTLTASPPSPQSAGANIHLTATVTGSGTAPMGTVTFSDGVQAIEGCSTLPLTQPTTACTWIPATASTYSLTVTYSGDTTYPQATSQPPLSYTIKPLGPAITAPAANPFALPESPGETGQLPAGTPLAFPIAGTRFPPGQQVSVEICDGLVATDTGWNLAADCDPLSQSPSAEMASAGTGDVAFPATGPSNSIKDFRGGSPSGTFNCVAPEDLPPNSNQNPDGSYNLDGILKTKNGEPIAPGVESWTNCQLRMATSLLQSTSDQQFLTLSIPDTAHGQATPVVSLQPGGPGPTQADTPVKLTATVGSSASGPPPTGTLTFVDTYAGQSAPIGGCAGVPLSSTTCVWTPVAGGPHTLTVEYGGDNTYHFTRSAPVAYSVTFLTTSVAISSFPFAGATVGSAIIINASLSASTPAPTGSINFKIQGKSIVGCSARPVSAGAAQCVTTFLPVGQDVLTATYSGDQTYAPAGSASLVYSVASVPVGAIAPTGTLVVTPPSGLRVREYVTLIMVLSGASSVPTGTAAFFENDKAIPGCAGVRVADGLAICTTTTLPQGTDRVWGQYFGDAVYQPAQSAARTVSVAP